MPFRKCLDLSAHHLTESDRMVLEAGPRNEILLWYNLYDGYLIQVMDIEPADQFFYGFSADFWRIYGYAHDNQCLFLCFGVDSDRDGNFPLFE
jgi:hypothetical protein